MSNIARDIRDGNVAAFKELFEDYYPVLCVFASKYLSDGEACKDVAQETLVSYWEHRAEFDDLLWVPLPKHIPYHQKEPDKNTCYMKPSWKNRAQKQAVKNNTQKKQPQS